jgi:HlyD family secretion protein
VRADAAGLTVYRDLFFGSDRRKPQVGDEVWSNQPLIAVPDGSHLTVDTRVREIDLRRLSEGQSVTIRVDAYPDARLAGRVSLVGALAQADQSRAGTRYFPVTVQILENDPRLRTGMTAEVDIRAASITGALVVPQMAVFGDGSSRYLVVLRKEPVREPVTVVAENETHAAIAGRVQAGDRVLLVDPTAITPVLDRSGTASAGR